VIAQSIALITYAVLAPIVWGLIDRFGPRRVIGPGILALTIGLIICSLVNALIQFYLLYGVIIGAGFKEDGYISGFKMAPFVLGGATSQTFLRYLHSVVSSTSRSMRIKSSFFNLPCNVPINGRARELSLRLSAS